MAFYLLYRVVYLKGIVVHLRSMLQLIFVNKHIGCDPSWFLRMIWSTFKKNLILVITLCLSVSFLFFSVLNFERCILVTTLLSKFATNWLVSTMAFASQIKKSIVCRSFCHPTIYVSQSGAKTDLWIIYLFSVRHSNASLILLLQTLFKHHLCLVDLSFLPLNFD